MGEDRDLDAPPQPADDGLQDPLVHEGGPPDGIDTNERGDERVQVQQPSGEPIDDADR
ncbi:MAG: hypothetical protein M3N53_08690 [Actinomycetota bacterium]|nr:hypothetical protein [Actinomycetota bacterium]